MLITGSLLVPNMERSAERLRLRRQQPLGMQNAVGQNSTSRRACFGRSRVTIRPLRPGYLFVLCVQFRGSGQRCIIHHHSTGCC
jgi:hypothetical protein